MAVYDCPHSNAARESHHHEWPTRLWWSGPLCVHNDCEFYEMSTTTEDVEFFPMAFASPLLFAFALLCVVCMLISQFCHGSWVMGRHDLTGTRHPKLGIRNRVSSTLSLDSPGESRLQSRLSTSQLSILRTTPCVLSTSTVVARYWDDVARAMPCYGVCHSTFNTHLFMFYSVYFHFRILIIHIYIDMHREINSK